MLSSLVYINLLYTLNKSKKKCVVLRMYILPNHKIYIAIGNKALLLLPSLFGKYVDTHC